MISGHDSKSKTSYRIFYGIEVEKLNAYAFLSTRDIDQRVVRVELTPE